MVTDGNCSQTFVEAQRVLRHLGLSDQAVRTYEALLDQPDVGPTLLAVATGAPTEAAALEALEELVRAGFVTRDRDMRYAAVPPNVAIPSMLMRRSEQAAVISQTVPALTERFWAGRRSQDQLDFIEIVRTREQIRMRWAQLDNLSKHSVRAFDRPPYVTNPLTINTHELASMKRGVEYRIVYSQDAVDIPGRWEILVAESAAGEQSRVIRDLPAKLTLFDDFAAIVSLQGGDADNPAVVMIVHESPLLDSLQELFETTWARSIPLSREGEDPTGRKTQKLELPDAPLPVAHAETLLARMLIAGLSDDAIRRQLNISVSTLQRRLRILFAELGVRNRLQAGYVLGRQDAKGVNDGPMSQLGQSRP